jgi:hypothetical protein
MKPPPPAGEPNSAGSHRAADELAVAALVFLAGDEQRLGPFLALTGLAPESLRTAAREPGFLLGVLDHVMGDESLLRAFANESGIDPEDVARARQALAGNPGDTGAA